MKRRGGGQRLDIRQNKRVTSKLQGNLILEEILVVYFLLKNQRNKTNHADDTAEDAATWSYGQICDVLKQMTEVLEEI